MVELVWDERFKKIYTKWIRQHPDLKAQFARKIVQLRRSVSSGTENPFPERGLKRALVVQDYL